MGRPPSRLAAFALAALGASATLSSARADEGMWTYDALPADLAARHDFTPSPAWLDHVRSSAVRLSNGCSASFVSANGLVLTNHHCAHSCIEDLSSAEHDYVAHGFHAKTAAKELICPGLELNQLVSIADVTERVTAATRDLGGEEFQKARRAITAGLEKECADSEALRCDVVSLYQGGVYQIYKYRRFDEVRLVFAPEMKIAFFGGDPDNFNFPRYDLDVAFLRAYAQGKPVATTEYLRWSKQGVAPGDLTVVAGNPGSTQRLFTVSQLVFERDVVLVELLLDLAQYRGFLDQYAAQGKEQRRVATSEIFFVENAFKAISGERAALNDPAFFSTLVQREDNLRAQVSKRPELVRKYGAAWNAIAETLQRFAQTRRALLSIEGSRGGSPWWATSDLFRWARTIVRGADERERPNEQRLPEFRNSRLERVLHHLLGPSPIDKPFEIAKLTFGLTRLREVLGADHAFVRQVLGAKSPSEVARDWVQGSRLGDPLERKRLWQGGTQAVSASTDSLIRFVKRIDAEARRVRAEYENEVESVLVKNAELVAQARFEVFGRSLYPDATGSPRLSFGQVRGWTEQGSPVSAFTTFGGAFARATGRDPFALPKSWNVARPQLDLDKPLNFVTDNDIIGGNSGSPVIDRTGDVVGLIFDGNIHSLGGAYGFDMTKNRAVAVDVRGIAYALEAIYGAPEITAELRAGQQ
ncbi:MAG TPA: S46 family peptidase [Polyangiaceae bacterium]|jgi:hypothetical protein|nr:S46 family peptidase [Polyangiaceae bacterium]